MVFLKASKLFSGMDAEELPALERAARLQTYHAGRNIFQEGDPGDGLYVIVEGKVQITFLVGQDQRRVLSRLGPGDFYGEMAVLDNHPRSATAAAETDTQVYFIRRDDLQHVLASSPALAVSLVKEFSLRMREFNQRYTQEVLQAERLTLVGRFARSIVHDFKNPLNIIGISAEMAALDRATPEMREAAKTRIRKQIERLSDMINELLEFTRGSSTAVVLARTNYADLVRQLIEDLRPEIAAKSVALELENDPPAVDLLMNPTRLAHVFYNIINNACDAMPDGGKVRLRFKQSEREILTEIEDTGRGIAPEIASSLFEAFATYGKAQGTGLGLSISKKIIEDHHGRIGARSEAGRGAVFYFSLPVHGEGEDRTAPDP
ncbi:MAG: cyclic nucleotide-binding domain-containing protein [Verrucomicrobia bacterium]|nr:MAG: cyclic nucleotide-binding domain-containing protein [Verrucomicrobiota bacterium]